MISISFGNLEKHSKSTGVSYSLSCRIGVVVGDDVAKDLSVQPQLAITQALCKEHLMIDSPCNWHHCPMEQSLFVRCFPSRKCLHASTSEQNYC